MGRNWTEQEWQDFEAAALRRIASRRNAAGAPDESGWREGCRAARAVLRNFSTSFFLVTRFLPAAKRAQVDVIYAGVRFPDEIVDTFDLDSAERLRRLDHWRAAYDRSLSDGCWRDSVSKGEPLFVSLFAEVVRRCGIPPEHYHRFLDAMAADAAPRTYLEFEDLIQQYVYGSAIVVGYFLAHVYGPAKPELWQRSLDASRDLGIALQLTNFLRDVSEDQRRGRLYLPVEYLDSEGMHPSDVANPRRAAALKRVFRRLSTVAEQKYSDAEANLDAFAPDCRVAIEACIQVYRRLNERIGSNPQGVAVRESVPAMDKFKALPPSKFWRVPLAYLGAI